VLDRIYVVKYQKGIRVIDLFHKGVAVCICRVPYIYIYIINDTHSCNPLYNTDISNLVKL